MKLDLPVPRLVSVRTLRRLPAALTIATLAVSGVLVAAPAQASTQEQAGTTSAECIQPAQRTTKWREGADTTQVSAAVRARVDRVVESAAGSSARASELPASVRVPVVIHIIHGRHRKERRINKRKARTMFYTLKAGFAGAQNPAVMAPTGVDFRLKKITTTRNDAWFHAAPFSRADRQMKKRLHRGKAKTLNIYVNRPRSQGQLLLGFSLFPWQRKAHKPLDGVTISEISLPGGRANGYNLGDTVIHETGHWMGLLHPFEGGCDDADGVADTPAEAGPSFRCEDRNTCPVVAGVVVDDGPAGLDPVHNFMDYSYDFCMDRFTPGQRERMIALFMHYRAGR